jgi:hypothetical protein
MTTVVCRSETSVLVSPGAFAYGIARLLDGACLV